jgi:hypothetical protein
MIIPIWINYPFIWLYAPNGSRLSRLAGCACIGSVYNTRQRRRHAPYLLAEGQVGCRVGAAIARRSPHRPGREQFAHPVRQ